MIDLSNKNFVKILDLLLFKMQWLDKINVVAPRAKCHTHTPITYCMFSMLAIADKKTDLIPSQVHVTSTLIPCFLLQPIVLLITVTIIIIIIYNHRLVRSGSQWGECSSYSQVTRKTIFWLMNQEHVRRFSPRSFYSRCPALRILTFFCIKQ